MEKNWLRYLVVGLAASVAGVAIYKVAYGNNNTVARRQPVGEAPIRLGYPALRIALPVFVAQEQGLFAKHGLKVELVPYSTAQPMMDALVGGALDAAGYCALPITFAAMARSKTPLLFVSAIREDNEHPISILLVGKNLSANSVEQLQGKRVGILPTRAYEVWLKKILAKHKVPPDSVIIQQIPPPQQVAALLSGSIEALLTNDPAATAAVRLGAGRDLSPGKAIVPETLGISPLYFGSFNVARAFADSNQDRVRRLTMAIDEAIDFILSDQQAAAKAMARFLPSEQAGMIPHFPPSLFQKTNDVEQEDLERALGHYVEAGILQVNLDLSNAQYHRR